MRHPVVERDSGWGGLYRGAGMGGQSHVGGEEGVLAALNASDIRIDVNRGKG